jgi:hypothetical protein
MTRPIKRWEMALASIAGLTGTISESVVGVLFIWFLVWLLIRVEEPR